MKRLWLIFFVIPIFAQETEKDDSFIQKMEVKAPIPHPNEAPDQWLLGPYRCRNHGITSGPS